MSENDNYNRSNVKRYTTRNFNIASVSPNLKKHFEFLDSEANNDSYYANKIIGK